MVFSQTDANPLTILKVVELNRLKHQKVNGTTGVNIGGTPESSTQTTPEASTSFSEVYLKPEPQFESTMFHDSDSEFFQNIAPWCIQATKAEALPAGIDVKDHNGLAHHTDTQNTPLSPLGWEIFDPNSPGAQATCLYYSTPKHSLSPVDGSTQFDNKFNYNTDIIKDHKMQFDEFPLDIESMPVVLGPGALGVEESFDLNPFPVTETVDPYNTYAYTPTDTHKKFILDDDDSLDIKNTVTPRDIEKNDVIISDYIINESGGKSGVLKPVATDRRFPGLRLNVNEKTSWCGESISTPDILTVVEQLEKEKVTSERLPPQWPLVTDPDFAMLDSPSVTTASSAELMVPVDYQPITLKSESFLDSDEDIKRPKKRKPVDSDDDTLDETYTPYQAQNSRRYKRRKPSESLADMIHKLEGAREKPKRGRPPKRRESTVSSIHSADDNSSTVSAHEIKYRELRDKNNEASKRSRMNRKLKELQMEQQAIELEERNKKLKVRADILEDMTKRLKDALMKAILQK